MSMIFGWYDELKPTKGMHSIAYWNHVVNEITPDANPNDVSLYTKKNYIKCLVKMLDASSGKFWIQLPYFQVYHNLNGQEIVIFEEYAYDIIRHFSHHDKVVGFYIADEPEIWGTEYSDHKHKFDVEAGKRVFKHIKNTNHEKLGLMVFCDEFLLSTSNIARNLHLLTDVVGFDYYPFETQKQVDEKGRGYVIKTQFEYTKVRERIGRICRTLYNFGVTSSRFMYVGQGTGDKTWTGATTFGQRDPSLEELNLVIGEFHKNDLLPRYYLFWSKSYSNQNVWETVWEHIRKVSDTVWAYPVPKDPRKPSIFRRIINFFKTIL